MKVMVYLGLLSLISMLVIGLYYIVDNSQEEMNNLIELDEGKELFQGPVQLGYDLEPSDAENPEVVISWSNPTYQNGSLINWRKIKEDGS